MLNHIFNTLKNFYKVKHFDLSINTQYPDLKILDVRKVKLLEPVEIKFYSGTKMFCVGETFNGASTPRVFWFIVPPFGKWIVATFYHDWCYKTKNGRKHADQAFYSLMIYCGVKEGRAKLMFYSVRTFGWINYYTPKEMFNSIWRFLNGK